METLCNQYNTTIASLQQLIAAMQSENRIKDIVPVMENGETVGYTITFTSGNPVTIYNGKNGQDDQFVYFVLTNGQTITIPKSRELTWVYV